MAGGGGLRRLKSVTHILQWWNLAQLYLPKEDPKNIWITWHTLWVLLASAFFHRKSTNVAVSRDADLYCILIHVSNSFKFSQVFKDCFNKYGYNFDDVNKNGYVGLLNITLIWSRGYDVIIYVHGVTNKILSRYSNYILDAVVWPKFGNSSISTREVIITSIL